MSTTTVRPKRKRRDVVKRAHALLFGLVAVLFASREAHASLTSSEETQVREYYSAARANDAAEVRSLVARPDLTSDESASVLSSAVASVAFTPARSAFLHAVLFGGNSLPSRSVIALATTRALLARANAILAKFPADFDAHADAVAEVARLFAFVEQEIAAVGPRRGVGAPPESGIAPATYDACAQAIADAIAREPKWLKVDAKLSIVAAKVRAQAELALLDMMNDSPTFRVDAADKLGLTGARRAFFLELGVLLLDDANATDPRVDVARSLFLRLPAARAGVEAVFFGDDKPGLSGKKEVIAVRSALTASGGAAVDLLPDDLPQGTVSPGAARVDPAIADLARELAVITVRRALENRGDLSLQATRDARAAIDAKTPLGKNASPSPLPADAVSTIAQAVELAAIDARAAFDVALARFRAGRSEPAALFSDAVGILAVYAPPAQAGAGLSLALGRSKGDGSTETVIATNVRLSPNGTSSALTIAAAPLEIFRDAGGDVSAVGANGKTFHAPRADSK